MDLAAYEKGVASGNIQQQQQHSQQSKLHNRRFIRRTGGRGRDSIYWDPVLNIPLPVGPPPGSRAAQALEERGIQASSRAPAASIESKTVYSSAPVMRDLVKEAAVLVPVSVQRHKAAAPPSRPLVPAVAAVSSIESDSKEKESNKATDPSSKQPLLEDYYGSDDEADDDGNSTYGTASGLAPEEEAYLRAQQFRDNNEDDN